MAINKVEYGGNTLIDLTSDSVTPENLLSGVTAHDASGKKITGTFDPDKYLEKTGDASDTTVTFVQATNRENISSKEKFSVIMGKIAKFFADLKTVAFTGKYSDLSGTPGVVSKTANGLCPKNGGTTTKFLRDDGTYAEPTASVSGLSTLEQVTAAATAGNLTAPVGAGAVNELNSSLNWKLIGTATGTQSIAVDSTKYNELNVIVCTGAHACYSFSIPSIYLDETIFNFVNGYFAYDNYMGMITLSADKTKIMLESVWQGGQNIANTCITKVYAR